MSPTTPPGNVIFGEELRVIDQDVRALSQLADAFVEFGVSRFVIGSIDENTVFGLDAEPKAPLRVIQPRRLNANAVSHAQASVVDVIEIAASPHLSEINRKVWRRH